MFGWVKTVSIQRARWAKPCPSSTLAESVQVCVFQAVFEVGPLPLEVVGNLVKDARQRKVGILVSSYATTSKLGVCDLSQIGHRVTRSGTNDLEK